MPRFSFSIRMTSVAAVALAGVTLLGAATAAHAGPRCTEEQKTAWMSEDAMKAKIAAMGYKDIRTFKVTAGNCYEIYGFDKDGKKAEVYFHPVTGAIVEAK